MGWITFYKGVIYDDKGEFLAIKTFSPKKDYFTWGKKSFAIDTLNASYFVVNRILWETRYYQYNDKNPHPYRMDKKGEPALNTELLNVQLENKVARDLNRMSENRFSGLLTPRNIMIGGLILLAYLYFHSIGKI